MLTVDGRTTPDDACQTKAGNNSSPLSLHDIRRIRLILLHPTFIFLTRFQRKPGHCNAEVSGGRAGVRQLLVSAQ